MKVFAVAVMTVALVALGLLVVGHESTTDPIEIQVAEFVPPIPFEVLPPESALAQQAIAVARAELLGSAAETADFRGLVARTSKRRVVSFADPDACQPPCPVQGAPDCGVVLRVELDVDAAQVVRSSFVRDIRCRTS
jgi:hypothetical protein